MTSQPSRQRRGQWRDFHLRRVTPLFSDVARSLVLKQESGGNKLKCCGDVVSVATTSTCISWCPPLLLEASERFPISIAIITVDFRTVGQNGKWQND